MENKGQHSGITSEIDKYYTSKLIEHGATPKGVDWNSVESQEIRFRELSRVINKNGEFSLLDYGCGFGSYYEYLNKFEKNWKYFGFDISSEMLEKAKELYSSHSNFHIINDQTILDNRKFDFVIASGIFNVRLNNSSEIWEKYLMDEIDKLNQISESGFSFNMLTKYSDPEYCKDYLYYGDPEFWFNRCKTLYSRNVALLHDYNLYEFTIIVRK